MSSLQQEFSSGQTQGQTQAKMEEMTQNVKDSAIEAKERTCEAVHSAPESAQRGTEQASGILNQTGEQARSMAQSAMDTVKSTLGVSDKTN